jgi:hypothetical protein
LPSDNGKLSWRNEKRRLADLTPWEPNPRQINEPQAERLAGSFTDFGQVETLAIDPDGEVVNGHQRLAVLRQQHGEDYEVDVRVASRKLTTDERKKLTIYLHEGATGEWDFDGLANLFEVDELKEWGFPEWKLNDLNLPDEWPEYDESIADEVEWLECPECGHKWPK